MSLRDGLRQKRSPQTSRKRSTMQLRDYQHECVQRVLDAYEAQSASRELIVLPCGAGKTVVFSHVIDALARKYGLSALIVAHMDELLNQAAEKYRAVRPDAVIGKIGSGIYEYGGEVTVAGIKTISKPHRLKGLQQLYGAGKKLIIVVDEAHLSAAPSYQRVMSTFPDAFVLLVTATPYRLDGKPIVQKPPLYVRTIQEMIREGYLCDVRAVAIRTDVRLDTINSTAGDYDEKELDLAVNTPARNTRIAQAYLEHANGKRALVFCVTVEHAKAVCATFKTCGVAAAVVSGETLLPERQRLYKAFDSGDIPVLVTVNVLSIGFDSPKAEVAILARPTKSQALYVQQIGRVLRLSIGKMCALVLDLTDNVMRMRIAPQNFRTAIGVTMRDGETLLQAEKREKQEKAERTVSARRALIRKLRDQRSSDVSVDLFALPDWEERADGLYVITTKENHRIAVVPHPSAEWAQLYEVQARLAPDFRGQRWATSLNFDEAIQLAEKKLHLLLQGKAD